MNFETLQKDLAQFTDSVQKKVNASESELKELGDKLIQLQKDVRDAKAVSVEKSLPVSERDKVALERKMDELFIARALCHDIESKVFNKKAFDAIAQRSEYADAIKAFGDVSADTTTGAGTGLEFIPKGFSNTLQSDIWLALEVAGLFGRINLPATDYTLPLKINRGVAKAGLEGGTVTKRQVGTGKISFAAKKLMAISEMTDEFEQDSMVAALPFIREDLVNSFAVAQDTMALNGDTGTTIYTTALSTAIPDDCRQLVKGLRRDAISTSTKVDIATGGISEDNLRAIRAIMGKYGKSPSDLAWIVSIDDYLKMLKFTGYLPLYAYGANAVVLTGELGRFDNIPIVVTELLPKAGRATDAADAPGGLNANGIWDDITRSKGVCVLAHKKGFMWGDRKEFTLDLWRNQLNQTTNLIGSMRLDFQKIVPTAATPVAVGVNY